MDLVERLRNHEVHAVHDYDDDCIEAASAIDELILRLSSADESEVTLLKRVVLFEAALVELRDEILPHWSKREAISFINEALE